MQINNVPILCEDGFELAGTIYIPVEPIKAAVMIAPATGIKQTFYTNFSKYLCELGFVVLTYDNRGIGQSLKGDIKEVNASLVDWGQLDMTAVLAYLKTNFPKLDYHLIGHSAGGQLVGLMKNAMELRSIFNYGCSSGSVQNATYPFKIKSHIFLNAFIPLSNLIFGHTKSQWVRMGEPLPKKVGQQWSRWCTHKGYIAVDLDTKIKDHFYNTLNINSLWVHSDDDDIANLANVKDMIRVFPKLQHRILTLHPQDYGYYDIGHMKFFSSKRDKLWYLATHWLNEQL